MLEKIENNGQLFAVLICKSYAPPGVEFLTADDESMQVGVMCHAAGYEIQPHVHRTCQRSISNTQEVLFIRKGRIRVDFYDNDKRFVTDRELGAGDAIILLSGGHGIEILQDVEMIEAKTGPFVGDQDKVRFSPEAEGKS